MGDDAQRRDGQELKKVAIACQGGGIHASFAVGVLSEILKDKEQNRFEVMGVSGTSAGALCALMVWYGLARKNGRAGSVTEAIERLNGFWDGFAATGVAEKVLNFTAYSAFKARELETPVLGLNAPVFTINPRGAISQAVTAALPLLGVRRQYFDLEELLHDACPDFAGIDWANLQTRLLVGATDVVNGIETVFDSDCNMPEQGSKHAAAEPVPKQVWRERLPLSLSGVAASGTLPEVRQAQQIAGRCYWDGLYSLNPPIREFWQGVPKDEVPEEIWVIRINPQQCALEPKSHAEIEDRENELMGNLSTNKELDFIVHMNLLIKLFPEFRTRFKTLKVRTIKMTQHTAAELRYSTKFNRSRRLIDRLRKEGRAVAREWLDSWPDKVGCYPDDVGYWPPRRRIY